MTTVSYNLKNFGSTKSASGETCTFVRSVTSSHIDRTSLFRNKIFYDKFYSLVEVNIKLMS